MGSSIAGIIDKRGSDVFERILGMLSATRHRGSENVEIAIRGKRFSAKDFGELDRDRVAGDIGIGVVWSGIERKFGQVNDSFHGILDGELYQTQESRKGLPRRAFEAESDIEIVVSLLKNGIATQDMRKNPEKMISQKLRGIDGVFAIAILHKDRIFIARDTIGVKPLYIGEGKDAIAFCSERKGLWSIGIENRIHPVEPDSLVVANKDGIRIFRRSWTHRIHETKLGESVEALRSALTKSVKKRIKKHDSVGLLFSGGLDSTVLAKMTRDLGKDPYLYCAGTRKARDVTRAKEIANMLDLPLRTKILTVQNIERNLGRIVYGIERNSFKAISIGIPIFFSAKLAKDDGICTVLSGQGADELFGGYARYENMLEKEGHDELQRALEYDVKNIAELNIQRDDHATSMSGVQIQLPYLDRGVVEFGLQIPIRFKIKRGANGWIRKFILRKLAESIDVPKEVCWAPKVALQYGSGSEKTLREIAKAMGFSRSFSKQYGYVHNVQLFVDCVAKQVGIPLEIPRLSKIIEELNFSL